MKELFRDKKKRTDKTRKKERKKERKQNGGDKFLVEKDGKICFPFLVAVPMLKTSLCPIISHCFERERFMTFPKCQNEKTHKHLELESGFTSPFHRNKKKKKKKTAKNGT